MHWLLQNNLYSEEGFESLVEALERFELPYSIHNVVPFLGELSPEPTILSDRAIVMGSYTLANYAKKRGWLPGAYLDNLDFEIQHRHWGDLMLNYDAKVYRFGDIPPQAAPFFIRPVHDTKSFTGNVTDWPSFVEWRNNVLALSAEDNPTVNADTAVMVSTKKEIYGETRTWIVDGRVVTASGYKVGTIKRYTQPHEVDARILDFAEAAIDMWTPNQAFVLDIADTPYGLFICEVNNLNSAGFYKGDVGKLIMALEALEAGVFEEQFVKMQEPGVRERMQAAFDASPEELGDAAVALHKDKL